jgi:DNA-directed RNA polymerase subunit RPC12/RpoP
MTTAIVTITCPSCGGKIEGITATNADQTIKCTYCGTDLHVPRVGEVIHEVVHEVIREVPSEPVYFTSPPPPVDLRPKSNPTLALILAGVCMVVAIPIMCQASRNSDKGLDEAQQLIDKQDAVRAKRAACEQSCKTTCSSAGDLETDETLKSADRSLCEMKCSEDKDCDGLKRPN